MDIWKIYALGRYKEDKEYNALQEQLLEEHEAIINENNILLNGLSLLEVFTKNSDK
ncbi:6038_t:CDS:1, partial [Racocetra persica]